MEINKTDPKIKAQFIALTAVTVGLVFAGWFFSFRDTWRSSNFSFNNGLSKITEVKDEVQNISTDFKEDIQPTVSDVGETVKAVTDVVNTETEQKKAAVDTIGEMMKENLEQPTPVTDSVTEPIAEPTN